MVCIKNQSYGQLKYFFACPFLQELVYDHLYVVMENIFAASKDDAFVYFFVQLKMQRQIIKDGLLKLGYQVKAKLS